MVAISQRSIPKDQLYENNKKRFVLNTTKISSFSLFRPCINDKVPHEQFLHFFPALKTTFICES